MRPLPINSHDSIFVLTGAGISAESGIPTFRDVAGYWRDRNIADVASPKGWERDPHMVWDFYSERRRTAKGAAPNEAHYTVAAWQRWLPCPVTVCTQNVDPLHEIARTKEVIHLHGELFKSRCPLGCVEPFEDSTIYTAGDPLNLCPHCNQPFRPHVCWFGEEPHELDRVFALALNCTVFIAIGTSGSVQPAASLVRRARERFAKTIYVGLEAPLNANDFDEIHLGLASQKVRTLLVAAEYYGERNAHLAMNSSSSSEL